MTLQFDTNSFEIIIFLSETRPDLNFQERFQAPRSTSPPSKYYVSQRIEFLLFPRPSITDIRMIRVFSLIHDAYFQNTARARNTNLHAGVNGGQVASSLFFLSRNIRRGRNASLISLAVWRVVDAKSNRGNLWTGEVFRRISLFLFSTSVWNNVLVLISILQRYAFKMFSFPILFSFN